MGSRTWYVHGKREDGEEQAPGWCIERVMVAARSNQTILSLSLSLHIDFTAFCLVICASVQRSKPSKRP
ncbi:hypothetical protein BDQ12DRAFT_688443 [Crucibulum laeve]|uniref:Uncharacterized protein n=1 Tax=Crucibulum laeve TaxID=68775 RepID=A0A5C3LQ11_9AGAR|nr:hypothetical protein BDQ12DRAFT_688443 [Crucibulum laeve]